MLTTQFAPLILGLTMAKNRKLVLEHLENISGRILGEYRETIRSMIRGRSGIYALYRKGKLYYVGLASNLMARLKTHLKDRHQGKWDRFSPNYSCFREFLAPLGHLSC